MYWWICKWYPALHCRNRCFLKHQNKFMFATSSEIKNLVFCSLNIVWVTCVYEAKGCTSFLVYVKQTWTHAPMDCPLGVMCWVSLCMAVAWCGTNCLHHDQICEQEMVSRWVTHHLGSVSAKVNSEPQCLHFRIYTVLLGGTVLKLEPLWWR